MSCLYVAFCTFINCYTFDLNGPNIWNTKKTIHLSKYIDPIWLPRGLVKQLYFITHKQVYM